MQERAISDLYDKIHSVFNTESQDQHRLVMALEDAEVHNTTTAHR